MKASPSCPEEFEQLAMDSYRSGHLEESIERFASARKAYLEADNPVKAAEIANNLCVVMLTAKQPQAALEMVQDTPELFLSQGDPLRAAQAFGNLGSAYEACSDAVAAEQAYQRAIEIFESLGDSDQHAYTLQALSRLQLRRGKPIEALSTMRRGLEAMPRPRLRHRLVRNLLKWPFRLLGR